MQSASPGAVPHSGQTEGASNTKSKAPGGTPRPRAKRKLSTLTKVLAFLITAASLGVMVLVLFGFWPPKSAPEGINIGPTPIALAGAGLKVV